MVYLIFLHARSYLFSFRGRQGSGLSDRWIKCRCFGKKIKRRKPGPINNQESRALILASLIMVDAVVIFEEDTPLELIKAIMPDVLVKGGDYTIEQIAGAKEVIANGGRVVINPITGRIFHNGNH